MTEQIFFTSDLHFGHDRMSWQWRDFSSVEEMDETLIDRWNACVGPNDRAYVLGDISFYNADKTIELVTRLNGHKHAVWGNHDKAARRSASLFESEGDYKEIKIEGQRIIMFHYPILSWHSVGSGSWMLHGHTHGNLPPETDMARMDVGVDTHDFYPYSFDEIRGILKDRHGLPGDHHGDKE